MIFYTKQKSILLQCLIVALLFGCSNQKELPSVLKVSNGKVERLENFPSKFVDARNVDIWLPEGYTSNKSYSVLYMHDGQMLFDSIESWNHQEWGVDETMSKLMSEKEIDRTIVIGIWNGGRSRHADYFPQKPFESLPEDYRNTLIEDSKRNEATALFSTDVQSDGYLKFIVEELKPYIDENYSTKVNMENTFIAGSSMGGLISMYAICEYPLVFGGAACLSTHWVGTFSLDNNPIPEAFMDYLAKNLPEPSVHKIYFDYGTETLDAMYEPFQLQVDSIMVLKGYDESNWKTIKFPGENHSENAWKKRLHIPLTFLLEQD
jgi:predicted alpha/beta superfamily hydrolase